MPWVHAHEYIGHRFQELSDQKYKNEEETMLKTFRQPDTSKFDNAGKHDDIDDRYDEIDPNKVYPDAKNLPPNTNEELDPDFKFKPTDPDQMESPANWAEYEEWEKIIDDDKAGYRLEVD